MSLTPTRGARNAPTINDVARHAGVSPMTVSRVINNEGSVRAATREKVEVAIAALNYAPSAAARQLAGGEETRIALLYSNPSAAYLSEFLMGCLDRASGLNLQLAVEKFAEDSPVASVVDHLQRGRVSGVVLPPPLSDRGDILAALQAAAIPVVAVAAGIRPDHTCAVGIDDFAAAHAMTGHLLALGHARIGFIKGNPDQSASQRRYDGYCAALADAGIALDPTIVAQGYFTYRSGLEAAQTILAATHRPSAIFASNDDMAAATVAMAHARRLDVPGDITVCGFDDTPLATTIWPELTTIRQPIGDMARAAVDMLLRLMRRRREEDAAIAHEQFDFALVRRQSDGPPPA
jgi:LacI family transcriptional regulator